MLCSQLHSSQRYCMRLWQYDYEEMQKLQINTFRKCLCLALRSSFLRTYRSRSYTGYGKQTYVTSKTDDPGTHNHENGTVFLCFFFSLASKFVTSQTEREQPRKLQNRAHFTLPLSLSLQKCPNHPHPTKEMQKNGKFAHDIVVRWAQLSIKHSSSPTYKQEKQNFSLLTSIKTLRLPANEGSACD